MKIIRTSHEELYEFLRASRIQIGKYLSERKLERTNFAEKNEALVLRTRFFRVDLIVFEITERKLLCILLPRNSKTGN